MIVEEKREGCQGTCTLCSTPHWHLEAQLRTAQDESDQLERLTNAANMALLTCEDKLQQANETVERLRRSVRALESENAVLGENFTTIKKLQEHETATGYKLSATVAQQAATIGELREALSLAKARSESIYFTYEVPTAHRLRKVAWESGYEAGWRGWAKSDAYSSFHHRDAYENGYRVAEQAVIMRASALAKVPKEKLTGWENIKPKPESAAPDTGPTDTQSRGVPFRRS